MKETLVVVSKVKQFIKNAVGMHTADGVKHVLTDLVEKACLEAIERAKAAGRKTVMDRDFKE